MNFLFALQKKKHHNYVNILSEKYLFSSLEAVCFHPALNSNELPMQNNKRQFKQNINTCSISKSNKLPVCQILNAMCNHISMATYKTTTWYLYHNQLLYYHTETDIGDQTSARNSINCLTIKVFCNLNYKVYIIVVI